MVTDTVNAGRIDVSPLKIGKPVKAVPVITAQLVREAAMMQASGTGEMTNEDMDKITQAIIVGTAHADTLNSR